MNRSQLIGSAKEMNRNAWFEELEGSGRTLRGRDFVVSMKQRGPWAQGYGRQKD